MTFEGCSSWQEERRGCLGHCVFSVATAFCAQKRRDAITWMESGDFFADGFHETGDVVAFIPWPSGYSPFWSFPVLRIAAAVDHFDQDLSRGRLGGWNILNYDPGTRVYDGRLHLVEILDS